MAQFANLSEAQRERLEVLAEEASEIVKCCTKVLRHGYASFNPDDEGAGTNRHQLTGELLDLWTVMERMVLANDIAAPNYYGAGAIWKKKMRYMHHQPPFHDPLDPPKKKKHPDNCECAECWQAMESGGRG